MTAVGDTFRPVLQAVQRGASDSPVPSHPVRAITLRALELLTSTVSLAELSAAVHSAMDAGERARRILSVQRVEATFGPLPFDVEAVRQYGIIAAEVIAMGRKPGGRVADLMIASIAAANKLPLFTTKPADFRGLESVVTVVPVPVPASAL